MIENISSKPFERDFKISDSRKKIEACLKLKNFKKKVTETDSSTETSFCEIFDKKGNMISGGCGKGEFSSVSCVAEALEHYYTCNFSNLVLKDIDKVFSKDPTSFIAKEYNFKKILSREYKNIRDPKKTLWVPAIISNPNVYNINFFSKLNEKQLNPYGTNSGSAIGCSRNEVLIHAINEVVERDALSIFIIKHFFNKEKNSVKVLEEGSIPRNLKDKLNLMEKKFISKIKILDITTDLNFPTYVTFLEKKINQTHQYGVGTSLNKYHALYRSITEMAQCVNMYDAEEQNYDKKIIEKVEEYKKWKDIIQFNVNFNENFKKIEFKDDKSDVLNVTELILKKMLKKLEDKGFSAFYSQTIKYPNGIESGHVYIPYLERFHILKSGNLVSPGSRGKEILNEVF
ncbi:MAG: YcaO-like family protein [Candidatus Pacebacteria bacterium]|nr:YcaO-like family protein [Candidatus Paceibacterota bacterium]